ncbi:MAG: hypothetical protein IH939_10415 [Acidobacteria bacterium]|nr:hypothetical protein [Acidobacteriota bacterium]
MTIARAVQPRMGPTAALVLLGVVALAVPIQAQPSADEDSLRAAVEADYRVTPISEGVGLLPRETDRGFALIELRGGTVVIDGEPVSGQELVARLGGGADLILRLTYLDPATQRSLFGLTSLAPVEIVETAEPITLVAPVTPVEPVTPVTPTRDRRIVRRNIVAFGGREHVTVDERVRGDVVVIGGSLLVDGEVMGNITVIGGSAEFGPEAIAHRDVTIVGGRLRRDPGARFISGVTEVRLDMIDLDFIDFGGLPRIRLPRPSMQFFRSLDLVGTLIRFAFFGLLGSVVLLVAAQSAERVARRVALEPVKAGVVGFLAQLLFVPLLVTGIILLVVTIIGIPLLVLVPVVLVGVLVVMVLGFTGVAQGVGQRLGGGVGQGHRSAFVLFWLGLALVMTPTLFGEALGLMPGPVGFFAVMLGIIGFVVEYVAWTTGLGAVILNRFGGEPAAVAGAPPPPIPEPPAGTPPPPPDLPLTEPPPSASDGRV